MNKAPDIFREFFRLDELSKFPQEHGLGLGLAIVKNIVRRLQGDICVDSEVGKGTTFYVRLPIAKR